jgi:hypothetical protein
VKGGDFMKWSDVTVEPFSFLIGMALSFAFTHITYWLVDLILDSVDTKMQL